MKDGSFMLNTLKHHYLFHMQNLFQNGANDILEMVNIISRFFCQKYPNFVQLGSSDFVQIASLW